MGVQAVYIDLPEDRGFVVDNVLLDGRRRERLPPSKGKNLEREEWAMRRSGKITT